MMTAQATTEVRCEFCGRRRLFSREERNWRLVGRTPYDQHAFVAACEAVPCSCLLAGFTIRTPAEA